MHIIWQAFNFGSTQTIIVISSNENLVDIGQTTEPFYEILDFLFGAVLGDVTSMHNDIGIRQVFKKLMLVVSVGDM